MWFDVGPMRLLLILLIIPLGFFLGRRGRPWLAALGPLGCLAALVPGYDIVSMLLALALLVFVAALVVYGARKWQAD